MYRACANLTSPQRSFRDEVALPDCINRLDFYVLPPVGIQADPTFWHPQGHEGFMH